MVNMNTGLINTDEPNKQRMIANIKQNIGYEEPRIEGGKKKSTHKWSRTSRKVTLSTGEKRTLYSNPAHPKELRIRRMVTRGNTKVATYVKPK